MAVSLTILDGNTQLSGNPILLNLTADSYHTKQKLAVKITCPLLFGSPFVAEQMSKNLSAQFDISGYFDQPLLPNMTFPFVVNPPDHPFAGLIFNVTLDVGEIYCNDLGERVEEWQNLSSNNTMRIIKGKLRPYKLAQLNELQENFLTYYLQEGKFLTNLPDKRTILPGQIPMLWFMSMYDGQLTYTGLLNIYTRSQLWPPIFINGAFTQGWGLVNFRLDAAALSNADKNQITQFSFQLFHEGNQISEKKTFLVDYNYYGSFVTLYYLNEFSLMEDITFKGRIAQTHNVESETATKPVPHGSNTMVPGIVNVGTKGRRRWELSTGPLTAIEMQGLRDLLESPQCWMIDPIDPNYLLPVLVEPGEYPLTDSNEDLYSLDLKIQEAH